MQKMKAKPAPAKPGQFRGTLVWGRVRGATTRGCPSVNFCIKPLLVSSLLPTLASKLCRDFVLKEKENKVIVVVVMFPEVPGVMSLHTASLQSICPTPHGCTQWAPKNHSFLCLCFLGVPTSYVLCPTHMDKIGFGRKVSHKHQFCWEED